MRVYDKQQFKTMMVLAVAFVLASLVPIVLRRPADVVGIRGMALGTLALTSLVSIWKYEALKGMMESLLSNFERKEYENKDLLKFYGIKSIEIDDGTIFVKATDGKRIGYSILRVPALPFPFQHLPDEIKEKFADGWLRVLNGIDFRFFIRIVSRPFDIEGFRERMEEKIAATVDNSARRNLQKMLAQVEEVGKNAKEKRFYVIIPATGKKEETLESLRIRENNFQTLLYLNLGIEPRKLEGDELLREFRSFFNPNEKEVYKEIHDFQEA